MNQPMSPYSVAYAISQGWLPAEPPVSAAELATALRDLLEESHESTSKAARARIAARKLLARMK